MRYWCWDSSLDWLLESIGKLVQRHICQNDGKLGQRQSSLKADYPDWYKAEIVAATSTNINTTVCSLPNVWILHSSRDSKHIHPNTTRFTYTLTKESPTSNKMQFSAVIFAVSATLVAAAPATDNMSRQVASGCYALFVPCPIITSKILCILIEADFEIL